MRVYGEVFGVRGSVFRLKNSVRSSVFRVKNSRPGFRNQHPAIRFDSSNRSGLKANRSGLKSFTVEGVICVLEVAAHLVRPPPRLVAVVRVEAAHTV